jgi:hypothetical protein
MIIVRVSSTLPRIKEFVIGRIVYNVKMSTDIKVTLVFKNNVFGHLY